MTRWLAVRSGQKVQQHHGAGTVGERDRVRAGLACDGESIEGRVGAGDAHRGGEALVWSVLPARSIVIVSLPAVPLTITSSLLASGAPPLSARLAFTVVRSVPDRSLTVRAGSMENEGTDVSACLD